jgi:hypothetical protein
MYSKEKSKELREEFWNQFKTLSIRRRKAKGLSGDWILTSTGVKALNLRFHVDREVAQVGIDLETRNMDKRIELFEKLEGVKKVLEEAMKFSMVWELEYMRENGKSVSRIYIQKENVDIYDEKTWPKTHQFMYDNMMKLETFYREYRDYFKYS